MIGQTISHYKILEKLGEGGMGVVYKAQDTKLDRTVALKFLPHHLKSNDVEQARFLQEAQSVATLNHPHICTIYAIEEFDDEQFIAMEYVDGVTLKEKVAIQKIEDALAYVVQIGDALQEAHKKGIVHRDIKSENIMVNAKNQIKVMDFGLAKFKDSLRLTRTGGTVGTLGYMPPEQLRGEKVDSRADIFSLGVVFTELLTGHLPFRGTFDTAMMYSIMNEEPVDPRQYRKDIPEPVVGMIHRALQKKPEDRYQKIEELVADLRSFQAGGLVEIPTFVPAEKSVAVLPFTDISPDKDKEFFSDGLTEELIADLSHIRSLRVICRSSAMKLKGTTKDLKTIAKELNVRYLLDGSVRTVGNNLRISAQLVDGLTEAPIWGEKFAGTIDDIFDIQEKVSGAIVTALKIKLSSEEDKKIALRPIPDPRAYECFLRARQEIFRYTEDALGRALKYLQTGLEYIGDNPMLYYGMGYTHWQYANLGIDPVKNLQQVEMYARKIFLLEPESPYGHRLFGFIEVLRGNPKESVKHLRRSLEIEPNDADALLFFCLIAGSLGKNSEATPYVERLIQIDPLTPMNHFIRGLLYLTEGKFEPALNSMQRAYEMDPANPAHRIAYAQILFYNNKTDEAIGILEQLISSAPESVFGQLGRFLQYTIAGQRTSSEATMIEEIKKQEHNDWYDLWTLAGCFSLLGEKQEALDYLERAVGRGFINYPFLSKHDLFLENIRGEARFVTLMEKVGEDWRSFEL